MAKVYDLSSYLEEEKSTIKVGEKEYEISDGFNNLLKIDALAERKDDMSTGDFIKEFLTISLGTEATNELLSMNYPTKFYAKLMNSIQDSFEPDNKEDASL